MKFQAVKNKSIHSRENEYVWGPLLHMDPPTIVNES